MPPEPSPWDRKDFFKDRKHERSDSLGSVSRWREAHHVPRELARWGSADFRRPHGPGKQGSWHMLPEESGHGTTSRSTDKILDTASRGDGKHGRNRDNRGSSSQKDWKASSWETSNSSQDGPPMKQLSGIDQRSVDQTITYSPRPHSDFVNTWDQLHFKEQHDKMGAVNGLGTGQRYEKENSLGSMDWKPRKWIRSGSLSSRGSGFSHSSSSKSLAVDCDEVKGEIQPMSVTSMQSPSGDAIACVTSAAPSEEVCSRKKPRLGWGEGLAKYEQKKVEGPDTTANRNETLLEARNEEPSDFFVSNVADKSPRITGSLDCTSPATPSSVACSSSPGIDDKPFAMTSNTDNYSGNLSSSPGPGTQNHLDGLSLNLENLELHTITNLSSSLLELLQSDDPNMMDSGFLRSTANKRLLLLRSEVSKALEVTESTIDSLETELKLLNLELRSCGIPASSSSLPVEIRSKPLEEPGGISNVFTNPVPEELQLDCERMLANGAAEQINVEMKEEDIDSPGTATSKLINPFPSAIVKHSDYSDVSAINLLANEKTASDSGCADVTKLVENNDYASEMSFSAERNNVVYQLILASNKDSACKASEVFDRLLPKGDCHSNPRGTTGVLCMKDDSLIKEKFIMRKRFMKFKEKAIVLKFRVLHYLWKEDLRLLSLRKVRAKPQKRLESSLRISNIGFQKHRSSIRSRIFSPALHSGLVPTTEIVNLTNKLLSDSQVKLYRDSLRMPALILDEKEKMVSRFISNNGLIEDPIASEKDRAMINPWTSEEKEIFMENLSIFGKDFKRIASFLDHKTTADCVEFYYKNHKADCFGKTKKKAKPSTTNTYLVTAGKRWSREVNAASLELLGAASVIASRANESSRRFYFARHSDCNTRQREDNMLESGNERETAAADVLAGICGSLSSEAMSSCVTTSVDHHEWNNNKGPMVDDATENVDDETCSEEIYGEMNSSYWTDEEKSIFIQAMSSYGRDFAMISRSVGTKSRDQCKVFFSKAKKCLGLDVLNPGISYNGDDDVNGGGSDTEDPCIVETDSVICGNKCGSKLEEAETNLFVLDINHDVADALGGIMESETDMKREEGKKVAEQVDEEAGDALVEDCVNEDLEAGKDEVAGQGVLMEEAACDRSPSRSINVVEIDRCGTAADEQQNLLPESSLNEEPKETSVTSSADPVAPGFRVAPSSSQDPAAVQQGENVDHNRSSLPVDKEADGMNFEEPFSTQQNGHNLLDNIDSSQKFPSAIPSVSKIDRNFQHLGENCYLKKCNGPNLSGLVADLAPQSHNSKSHSHSRSKSDTESSCKNGDVKLFGQILRHPSSLPERNAKSHDNLENGTHRPNSSSKAFNMGNNYLDLENNLPSRSYGFWDGNRIQTGFSSLPDSALLLAKYPQAFGKYQPASSKMEQSYVNDPSKPHGVTAADYQMYRSHDSTKVVQPFTVDRNQRKDIFLEMQRTTYESISNIGILVNGACNGGAVSDPVAAIKLHYAKADLRDGNLSGGDMGR